MQYQMPFLLTKSIGMLCITYQKNVCHVGYLFSFNNGLQTLDFHTHVRLYIGYHIAHNKLTDKALLKSLQIQDKVLLHEHDINGENNTIICFIS